MRAIVCCCLLAVLTSTAFAMDAARFAAFAVAPVEYLVSDGIPAALIHRTIGEPVAIRLQESPKMRWNSAWGSYPKFVVNVLQALGDHNAVYKGSGSLQVSSGERKLLADTVKRFREELARRGLVLRLITLDRDMSENRSTSGDVNSDHLIGFAADGIVKPAPCKKAADCTEHDRLARTRLEIQLRIIEAATTAGAQQLNLYGVLREHPNGQSIHLGVSPFRNGSRGEMLGKASAEGLRRIGYGSAQKGEPGALFSDAARYVGFDGTHMADAFQKLLHNPPPQGFETIYNAIRERDLDGLKALELAKS